MGFFDDPRTRRLKRDYAEMLKLQEESSILEFKVKGDPPEHYDIVFHGKVLASANPVKFIKKTEIQIDLGAGYPMVIPQVHWKTPTVNPNVSSGVCWGLFQMNPGVPLTAIVEYLWDYARLHTYNPFHAMKHDVDWDRVREEIGLPTDHRILRDKAPSEPEPPSREGPEEEGDIFVIEGSSWRRRRDLEALADSVEEYLEARGLDLGARVFDQEEWRERGELYGNDALVTITTEGPLGQLLNYGDTPEDEEEIAHFDEFLANLGLRWELADSMVLPGYAWSIRLYPLER